MSLESKLSKIGKALDSFFSVVCTLIQNLKKNVIKDDALHTTTTQSVLIFDSFIAFLSFFISIHIKVGMEFIDYSPIYILKNMLVFGLVSASVFLWTHTYQSYWKYTSVADIIPVIFSVFLINILFFPMMILMNQDDALPYSVIIVNFFVLTIMLMIPRFMTKILYDNKINKIYKIKSIQNYINPDKALLVGTPASVDIFLRDVLSNEETQFNFDPVAILSLNQIDVGHSIKGIPVLGDIKHVKSVFRTLLRDKIMPKQIIITEHTLPEELKKILISHSQANNILLVHVIHRCTFNTMTK